MLQWMCDICLIVLAPQPGGLYSVSLVYLTHWSGILPILWKRFESCTSGTGEVAFDILLCRNSTYLLPQRN